MNVKEFERTKKKWSKAHASVSGVIEGCRLLNEIERCGKLAAVPENKGGDELLEFLKGINNSVKNHNQL